MTPPPDELRFLPLESVDAGRYQPRRHFDEEALDELAQSIRQQGMIQPIVVRRVHRRYEIIAGERRWRAAQRAGLREIPALVRCYSDEQALEAALVENVQREDITIVETARAYHRLMEDFHYTQGQIALRTGKSRPAVANAIRLLQLPDTVLARLDRGELTEGHARVLLQLPYASLQSETAEWAVRRGASVRETEREVRRLSAAQVPSPDQPPAREAHIRHVEDRLRQHFGTKAEIDYRAGKGAIRLEFYTDDDLERVLELLQLPEV